MASGGAFFIENRGRMWASKEEAGGGRAQALGGCLQGGGGANFFFFGAEIASKFGTATAFSTQRAWRGIS